MESLRCWKKVYENDLENIIHELKDVISLPAVLILSGPVGAGKTTFTKYFVGKREEITSPTYGLVQESGAIAHADFYRLKDGEELIHLELGLYLEGKDFFLIEWGKNFLRELKRHVPEDFLYYEIDISINEPSEKNHFIESRNIQLNRLD